MYERELKPAATFRSGAPRCVLRRTPAAGSPGRRGARPGRPGGSVGGRLLERRRRLQAWNNSAAPAGAAPPRSAVLTIQREHPRREALPVALEVASREALAPRYGELATPPIVSDPCQHNYPASEPPAGPPASGPTPASSTPTFSSPKTCQAVRPCLFVPPPGRLLRRERHLLTFLTLQLESRL